MCPFPKPNLYLSKSLYTTGIQCHKALWLLKYKPELKDEISSEQEAIFESGTEIGRYAQGLFPGGILVPYNDLSHSQQLDMTQDAFNDGATTIYEATFSFNDVFIKADILHLGPDGWELYEVKSSASFKNHYIDDIAIQYHVISGTGLPLAKAYLVHLNKEYVRQGDIDVQQLFTKVELTEAILAKQPDVKNQLTAMRKMLRKGMPDFDISHSCEDPYPCQFHGYCWSHIPENSVFDFRGHGRPKAMELYRQGIVRMEDVPPDTLGWRQKLQLDGLLHQKNYVDREAVKDFLDSLWYPLCFMDFETTYMVPIPLFDGMSPYEQLPFQFSLHIVQKPGQQPVHHSFLSTEFKNPCEEFLSSLLNVIPPKACILAWNKTFEVKRLEELADRFPQKRSEINTIVKNMRDLMAPFRDKSIYHWKFNGSYSIKDVLPALVPEYSYENMPINSGDLASAAWVRMIQEINPELRAVLHDQLFEYCYLDTKAMVLIWCELKAH